MCKHTHTPHTLQQFLRAPRIKTTFFTTASKTLWTAPGLLSSDNTCLLSIPEMYQDLPNPTASGPAASATWNAFTSCSIPGCLLLFLLLLQASTTGSSSLWPNLNSVPVYSSHSQIYLQCVLVGSSPKWLMYIFFYFLVLESHCSKTAVLDLFLFWYLVLDITLTFTFYVITKRFIFIHQTLKRRIYISSLAKLKNKREKKYNTCQQQ